MRRGRGGSQQRRERGGGDSNGSTSGRAAPTEGVLPAGGHAARSRMCSRQQGVQRPPVLRALRDHGGRCAVQHRAALRVRGVRRGGCAAPPHYVRCAVVRRCRRWRVAGLPHAHNPFPEPLRAQAHFRRRRHPRVPGAAQRLLPRCRRHAARPRASLLVALFAAAVSRVHAVRVCGESPFAACAQRGESRRLQPSPLLQSHIRVVPSPRRSSPSLKLSAPLVALARAAP